MVRLRACALACALCAFLLPGKVSAQTIEWTNGDGTGLWSDALNWSTPPTFWSYDYFPPDSFDSIDFNLSNLTGGGPYTTTVDGPDYVQSLTIEGTGGLTIDSAPYYWGSYIVIEGSLTDSSSGPVAISAQILGPGAVIVNGGSQLVLTSPDSHYSGGTTVTSGTIAIGASGDGGYLYGVSTGPIGTGTLTLGDGTGLTTVDSNPYTLGNNIYLSGSGTVHLMQGVSGGNLTLNGNINGSANIEIAASGNSSANEVSLTSPNSFFAGVTVDAGNTTLFIAASSTGGSGFDVDSGPVGFGTLTLGDGTNLATAAYGITSIGNDILLSGTGTVTLEKGTFGDVTLTGDISGAAGLEVTAYSQVTLKSSDSNFGGGVTVDSGDADVPTTLVIGGSSSSLSGSVVNGPVGTGTLSLGDDTTLTTTDGSPYEVDNNIALTGTGTVYLLGGSQGGNLTLGGQITGSAGLEIPVSNGSVGNTIGFSSATSTFSGGILVDDYPGYPLTTLVIGASSTTGSGGIVTMGPLGTGTLVLDPDTTVTTNNNANTYTIGNNIQLNNNYDSDNNVYLLGTKGGNLNLSGTITGEYDNSLQVMPSTLGNPPSVVVLSSPNSMFGGGVRVEQPGEDDNSSTLVIGASSSGYPGGVTSGPLGTGELMLGVGSTLSTNSSSIPYTIANAISIPYENGDADTSVTLLGASSGGTLILTGWISGDAGIDIPATTSGVNTVTLTNHNSDFTGGVSLGEAEDDDNAPELIIGASSSGGPGNVTSGPLGTGTLTMGAGSTLMTNSSSTPYTIDNAITLVYDPDDFTNTVNLLGTGAGGNLTLTGAITGNAGLEIEALTGVGNTLTLTSGNSTFSGGVFVHDAEDTESGTTLIIGASSVGSPGSVTSGPLGTGALTIGAGSTLTTDSSSTPFTLANPISLFYDSDDIRTSVILLGTGLGGNLTLSGSISGSGVLKVAAGGSGTNTVTLSSPTSDFNGGVTVDGTNDPSDRATLVVGANVSGPGGGIPVSGPLGTGTLTLGNYATLLTPPSTPIEILNNIALGNGTANSVSVTLGSASSGQLLLLGTIADDGGPGALVIDGPVNLQGSNTYTGGTTINATSVTIGSNTGLGYGAATATNSTLNFTSASPTVSYSHFVSSVVNFTGMSPELYRATLQSATTINFEAGSSPSVVDLVSDAHYSNNAINLGSGASTSLTFQVDGQTQYNGSIVGNGSLDVTTGSEFGVLELGPYQIGSNNYTGGTNVSGNTLLVAGNNFALGSGLVTVDRGGAFGAAAGVTIANPISIPNDGAGIGGFGTLSPSTPQFLVIQSGSFVTGGSGTIGYGVSTPTGPIIGTLSLGPGISSLVLGTGGMLQFSIMNAGGNPGTDFSQISVSGNVNITASPGNDFTIQLVGVDSAGYGIGTANSFNPAMSYSWTLLSAASITNFNAADFVVDSTSFFSNSTGTGSFFVTDTGTSLVLDFTPVPEPSTWALMACGVCALAALVPRRRLRQGFE